MYILIHQKDNKCIAHRYITFIIFVCSAFNVFAQQDISKRINDVIETNNTKEIPSLISQITESDVANMPDSTLLSYYYLLGYNAYEDNNIEKQIEYLEKAKDICETRLGIDHNIFVYFEIIKALGEACEDLGKDDEALLWYEEGIIKGFPYLDTEVEPLKTYLDDIRDNSADIYEKKGFHDIAKYLRTKKPFDYIGSFDYARELLSDAIQLREKNSNEAIKLLDEAKKIFKKSGSEGKEMMQPLYREYLQCFALMGDTKKINDLLRSKGKIMFYNGTESYLISDMHEVIATFIITHHDINTAEYYYQKLLTEIENTNTKDSTEVAKIGKSISFFKNIYTQIDNLENEKSAVQKYSYEWGITSLKQANLLINIQRYDDANKICEQIYNMSISLKEDPQNLHWFVLMKLADYNIQNKNIITAERYLKEQMKWLDFKQIPSDSESRGWIYNKLGIAYLNEGQLDKSKEMLTKAEQIILPIYGKQSQEYATILHNNGRLAQLEGNLDEAKLLLEKSAKIQIEVRGKVGAKTSQYLDEVNHAIDVRL